ncbi:Protein broad-minded [Dufourea novaeangliae]|uniref:Protein broad-minded n=1 Tax=Dufourea novaeangliae TaxID=178035 RepID=A0A154PT52_DUFNO|nr:Protein broad-minded [Dufourea novaeangliae]
MENDISPSLQKWIKKCLKKEFEASIQKCLDEGMDCTDITKKMIHSKEMSALLNTMRATIGEQSASRSASTLFSDSRPQSSLSCLSDQTSEDWNSPFNNDEYYNVIVDEIGHDKPAHVRLAAYEVLLKNDLSNLNNNPIWNSLKKALLDSLTDESRPIFEASLQVHAKLLSCLQSYDVYMNLQDAFNAQYHSQKTFEILPTLFTGINFKFFLHERVFHIIHLILQYHEEKLKSARNSDKPMEELIEEFIIFLSTHVLCNATQSKTLNVLNIISILEPRADWCKKWIVNFASRKMFLTALGKSPSFLQNIMYHVQKGLEDPPHSVSVSIFDEPVEVIINGNTIETVTYLHCLCFVSQLCAQEAGRRLLDENVFENPFSVSEFITASLKALNKLSVDTLNGVAVNMLLLKMVSIPFGLKALVRESSVFQELIEGCIAPLRMSWNSMRVVNFVSSAAFFHLGYNTLANLAPHILSTLLSETCFSAFMTNAQEPFSSDEQYYPHNLPELFRDTINQEYDISMLPPPKLNKQNISSSETEDFTELETLLRDNKSGLLDNYWVEDIREAFKILDEPMKNTVLILLIDQMHKAIPIAEWEENFQWEESFSVNTDFWFPEEIHGIDLALYYAEQNNVLANTLEMKKKLQGFINACYTFIQYERPKKFDGFDWFLATVFIICEGDIEKCKILVTQLIRFPVTTFLWPNLGKVSDKNIQEECAAQFTFMQLLETVINKEFPHIKFALMMLDDYHCHEYIRFMDILDKRYGNKILPKLIIKDFNSLSVI